MQEIQAQSLGREDSPGGGNDNLLQYYCWKNPMNRGAWWAIVHGATKTEATEQEEGSVLIKD